MSLFLLCECGVGHGWVTHETCGMRHQASTTRYSIAHLVLPQELALEGPDVKGKGLGPPPAAVAAVGGAAEVG